MVTIRSLTYLVFLSLSVVVYAIPLSTLGWLMSRKWRGRLAWQWAQANLVALRFICGLDYRVRGLENLPSSNCIVLSKHQSTWETIALRALLPPEQTWVLKRELLFVPFFGWALAPLQPIAIKRKAGRRALRQLLEEGTQWLRRGQWIVIFPEGTRVAPGQRKKYGQGGAMLARKAGCPVIPVAHNAGVFWPRRSVNKYSGTIELVFGQPIEPGDRSPSEINALAEEWIEGTVASLPQSRLRQTATE
ncbi:MAG: lysophospholipid acyltransferase family protein [Chromatiaceae bacterium]